MNNILHCPNCGGGIIINKSYTLRFTKKMILTDDGFDELTDKVSDEMSSPPVQSIGSAYCSECGKEWNKIYFEIGIDINNDSVSLIELSDEERRMRYSDRKEYFREKGIEIIA